MKPAICRHVLRTICVVSCTVGGSVLGGETLVQKLKLPTDTLEQQADTLASETADTASLAKAFVTQRLELQASQLQTGIAIRDAAARDEAWVPRNALWPKGATILVSWENATAANAEERKWIQAAVERTWQKECGIRFTGWQAATSTSKGIRILISEDGPHVKRLGKFLDGMQNGMELNTSFAQWCRECAVDRQGSIEKIAVHEFGHALGFAHEQNRGEAPGWCQAERQGTDGDWKITIYDPSSVMNYCNENWNNGGNLSDLDIAAARIVYGEPPPQHAEIDAEFAQSQLLSIRNERRVARGSVGVPRRHDPSLER